MAIVTITDNNRRITEPDQIKQFLSQYGIWFDQWVIDFDSQTATQEEVLSHFADRIDELKKRGGYVTADVIDLSPSTPGLDQMLERFLSEHTHSEDEVRFVITGRGVFHINPESDPVFAIEMGSGDLISVPAGTKHWFNLCAEKRIRTIRLFQDTSGWTPHYTESLIHKKHQPLCMGDSDIPRAQAQSISQS